MSDFATVIWTGISRRTYSFQCYPIGTQFLPNPGVYIFCKPNGPVRWDAVYIGETESFARRLWSELVCHHQWEAIRKHGATHVCVLPLSGGVAAREAVETDLRHSNPTPCNLQGTRSVA